MFEIDLTKAKERAILLGVPEGSVRVYALGIGYLNFCPCPLQRKGARNPPGLYVELPGESFQDLASAMAHIFAWYATSLEGLSNG